MTLPDPSHVPDSAGPLALDEPENEPDAGSGRRRVAGNRVLAGAVLLILACLLFAASRVVAAGQRHAYDPGAVPEAGYAVTAGRTYQLSASRSVAELKKAGLLGDLPCFTTSATGEQNPLALTSLADDDRNLHQFATFLAPVTGSIRVSCTGIADVFIDDADSAAPDRSALLVLLSAGVGLLGVIAVCSGGYARWPQAELD